MLGSPPLFQLFSSLLHHFNMARSGLIIVALLIFLALHQDVWFWNDDKTLFFGFLPVGLAYHAVYTVAIAMFWGAVVMVVWPERLEAFAEETPESGNQE